MLITWYTIQTKIFSRFPNNIFAFKCDNVSNGHYSYTKTKTTDADITSIKCKKSNVLIQKTINSNLAPTYDVSNLNNVLMKNEICLNATLD